MGSNYVWELEYRICGKNTQSLVWSKGTRIFAIVRNSLPNCQIFCFFLLNKVSLITQTAKANINLQPRTRIIGLLTMSEHWTSNCYFSSTGIDLLAILKKNLNRTTFVYILKNFRMCTIAMEAKTTLDRTSCI